MNLNLGDTQLIIQTGKNIGLLRNQLAYILATAYHETAHTMKPVKEAYWVQNAEAWRKAHLKYYPWYGRGYVQLTWDYNYKKASGEIGVDLTKNPELAMVPENAAKILILGIMEGWFAPGKKLSDYVNLKHSDFVGARHLVNGTDKADLIAGYAKEYDADLLKMGYGVTNPQNDTPSIVVPPVIKEQPKPEESQNKTMSLIMDIVLKLIGIRK